jgi:hypothetical protein
MCLKEESGLQTKALNKTLLELFKPSIIYEHSILEKTKSLMFNYLFTEFGNSSYRCSPVVPSLVSSKTNLQTSRVTSQTSTIERCLTTNKVVAQ